MNEQKQTPKGPSPWKQEPNKQNLGLNNPQGNRPQDNPNKQGNKQR